MLGAERTADIARERGEIDRRLGVGREYDEGLAGRHGGERLAGADERERAAQPAGVDYFGHVVG